MSKENIISVKIQTRWSRCFKSKKTKNTLELEEFRAESQILWFWTSLHYFISHSVMV